jgi:Transglutaminase-like superfamily.
MKKQISLVFLFALVSSIFSTAQDVKFGKISQEELEMVSYENDTTAAAVVLHEELETYYNYNSRSFFDVRNRYFVRIKILTNEGLDLADQYVSRYVSRTNAKSEQIIGLAGFTYNLEGGKIEKNKLSKEHIFEEKTSEYVYRTKFAFQSVKPGSVIEYKYELTSPNYWDLKDYYFQRSIPVKYSRYNLQIPEYFHFSKESRGLPISLTETQTNQTININQRPLTFTSNVYNFVAKNLPALKSEDFIWSMKDYLTRVTFELHSFIIVGTVHETFSTTWDKVDEQLLENSSFGRQFNHKLFKEDFSTLFTPDMENMAKVRAIYNMVREKIKWNDINTFNANNPRDALRKGVGTSGEINAILISALREAGFDAYPIAMRLRNTGRLHLTHPTIDNFNYFVVAAEVDGTPVYMDASSKYGDLNVMSPSCLSDLSRSIRGSSKSSWVNLSNITKSTKANIIIAEFNEDGVLSGKVREGFSHQLGYRLRNEYSDSKTEQDFFDKKASDQNIEISSYKVSSIDNTSERVQVEYNFTKKHVVLGDEYVYFNPLIFPLLGENPFKAEKRELPVELSYLTDTRQTITIKIPEGYEVEEMPKPTMIAINDKSDALYQYSIVKNDDTRSLTVTARFVLNKIMYTQEEYQALRDFHLHIVTSNNEQVVLKKIAQ